MREPALDERAIYESATERIAPLAYWEYEGVGRFKSATHKRARNDVLGGEFLLRLFGPAIGTDHFLL